MIVDMFFANVFVEPPLPQRVAVVDGRTQAIAIRNAGETLPIRTARSKHFKSASRMRRLPYTFVLFWCAQSLDLLVLGEVGKVGHGLKRDVRGHEEAACAPSFLDQVHVSETELSDRDAFFVRADSLGVQITLLLQSRGQLSAPI